MTSSSMSDSLSDCGNEGGARAVGTGLSSTTEPQSSQGLGPSGFDPSREDVTNALAWIISQASEGMSIACGCATTHGDDGGGLEMLNSILSDIAINAQMALDGAIKVRADAFDAARRAAYECEPLEGFPVSREDMQVFVYGKHRAYAAISEMQHGIGRYHRDSDRSGEAIETAKTGSTSGESAGPKDIAQTSVPSPQSSESNQ